MQTDRHRDNQTTRQPDIHKYIQTDRERDTQKAGECVNHAVILLRSTKTTKTFTIAQKGAIKSLDNPFWKHMAHKAAALCNPNINCCTKIVSVS